MLLEEILSTLKDEDRYVEYWSRPTWEAMHFHQDLNEQVLFREERLECPTKKTFSLIFLVPLFLLNM